MSSAATTPPPAAPGTVTPWTMMSQGGLDGLLIPEAEYAAMTAAVWGAFAVVAAAAAGLHPAVQPCVCAVAVVAAAAAVCAADEDWESDAGDEACSPLYDGATPHEVARGLIVATLWRRGAPAAVEVGPLCEGHAVFWVRPPRQAAVPVLDPSRGLGQGAAEGEPDPDAIDFDCTLEVREGGHRDGVHWARRASRWGPYIADGLLPDTVYSLAVHLSDWPPLPPLRCRFRTRGVLRPHRVLSAAQQVLRVNVTRDTPALQPPPQPGPGSGPSERQRMARAARAAAARPGGRAAEPPRAVAEVGDYYGPDDVLLPCSASAAYDTYEAWAAPLEAGCGEDDVPLLCQERSVTVRSLEPQFRFDRLTPGTLYVLSARAVSVATGMRGPWSARFSLCTLPVPHLRLAKRGADFITVGWSVPLPVLEAPPGVEPLAQRSSLIDNGGAEQQLIITAWREDNPQAEASDDELTDPETEGDDNDSEDGLQAADGRKRRRKGKPAAVFYERVEDLPPAAWGVTVNRLPTDTHFRVELVTVHLGCEPLVSPVLRVNTVVPRGKGKAQRSKARVKAPGRKSPRYPPQQVQMTLPAALAGVGSATSTRPVEDFSRSLAMQQFSPMSETALSFSGHTGNTSGISDGMSTFGASASCAPGRGTADHFAGQNVSKSPDSEAATAPSCRKVSSALSSEGDDPRQQQQQQQQQEPPIDTPSGPKHGQEDPEQDQEQSSAVEELVVVDDNPHPSRSVTGAFSQYHSEPATEADDANPCTKLEMQAAGENAVIVQWSGDPGAEDASLARDYRLKIYRMNPGKLRPPSSFFTEDPNQTRASRKAKGRKGAAASKATQPPSEWDDVEDPSRTFESLVVTSEKNYNISELEANTEYGVKLCGYSIIGSRWFPWSPVLMVKTLQVAELVVLRLSHNEVVLGRADAGLRAVPGPPRVGQLRVTTYTTADDFEEPSVTVTEFDFQKTPELVYKHLLPNSRCMFEVREEQTGAVTGGEGDGGDISASAAGLRWGTWSSPIYVGCRCIPVDISPGADKESSFEVEWLDSDINAVCVGVLMSQMRLLFTAMNAGKEEVFEIDRATRRKRFTRLPHDRYRVQLMATYHFTDVDAWRHLQKHYWGPRYAAIALIKRFEVLISKVGEDFATLFCVQEGAQGVGMLPRPHELDAATHGQQRELFATLTTVTRRSVEVSKEEGVARDVKEVEVNLTSLHDGERRTVSFVPTAGLSGYVAELKPGVTYSIQIRPQLVSGSTSFWGSWSDHMRFTTLGKLSLEPVLVGDDFVHVRWSRPKPYRTVDEQQEFDAIQAIQYRWGDVHQLTAEQCVELGRELDAEKDHWRRMRETRDKRRGNRRRRRRAAERAGRRARGSIDTPPRSGGDALQAVMEEFAKADRREVRRLERKAWKRRVIEEIYAQQRVLDDARERFVHDLRQQELLRRLEARATRKEKAFQEGIELPAEPELHLEDITVELTEEQEQLFRVAGIEVSSESSEDDDPNVYLNRIYSTSTDFLISIRMEGQDRPFEKGIPWEDNMYLVQNLKPGVRYSIRLKQRTMVGGWSEWSNPIVIQTLTDVRVKVHQVGEEYVELSCTRAPLTVDSKGMEIEDDTAQVVTLGDKSKDTGYQVRVTYRGQASMTDEPFEYVRDIKTSKAQEPFLVCGMVADSMYSICVRVQVVSKYWGKWSDVVSFRTAKNIECRLVSLAEDSLVVKWRRPPIALVHPQQPILVLNQQGEYEAIYQTQQPDNKPTSWTVVVSGAWPRPRPGRRQLAAAGLLDDDPEAWENRNQTFCVSAAQRHMRIDDLCPDSIYRVAVKSYDATGVQSPNSPPLWIATLPMVRAAPTKLGERYMLAQIDRAPRSPEITRRMSLFMQMRERVEKSIVEREQQAAGAPMADEQEDEVPGAFSMKKGLMGVVGIAKGVSKITRKLKSRAHHARKRVQLGELEALELMGAEDLDNMVSNMHSIKDLGEMIIEGGYDHDYEMRAYTVGEWNQFYQALLNSEQTPKLPEQPGGIWLTRTDSNRRRIMQNLQPGTRYVCVTRALHQWIDSHPPPEDEEPYTAQYVDESLYDPHWGRWSAPITIESLKPITVRIRAVEECCIYVEMTKHGPVVPHDAETNTHYQISVNSNCSPDEVRLHNGRSAMLRIHQLARDSHYSVCMRNEIFCSDPRFDEADDTRPRGRRVRCFDNWYPIMQFRTLPRRPCVPIIYEARPDPVSGGILLAFFWRIETDGDMILCPGLAPAVVQGSEKGGIERHALRDRFRAVWPKEYDLGERLHHELTDSSDCDEWDSVDEFPPVRQSKPKLRLQSDDEQASAGLLSSLLSGEGGQSPLLGPMTSVMITGEVEASPPWALSPTSGYDRVPSNLHALSAAPVGLLTPPVVPQRPLLTPVAPERASVAGGGGPFQLPDSGAHLSGGEVGFPREMSAVPGGGLVPAAHVASHVRAGLPRQSRQMPMGELLFAGQTPLGEPPSRAGAERTMRLSGSRAEAVATFALAPLLGLRKVLAECGARQADLETSVELAIRLTFVLSDSKHYSILEHNRMEGTACAEPRRRPPPWRRESGKQRPMQLTSHAPPSPAGSDAQISTHSGQGQCPKVTNSIIPYLRIRQNLTRSVADECQHDDANSNVQQWLLGDCVTTSVAHSLDEGWNFTGSVLQLYGRHGRKGQGKEEPFPVVPKDVDAGQYAFLVQVAPATDPTGGTAERDWHDIGEVATGTGFCRLLLPVGDVSDYAFRVRGSNASADKYYNFYNDPPTDGKWRRLWSAPSVAVVWQRPEPPAVCRHLGVSNVAHDAATLHWRAPQDARRHNQLTYNVYTRRAGVDLEWVLSARTRSFCCRLTGLAIRSNYRACVRAVSTFGISDYSSIVRFSTALVYRDEQAQGSPPASPRAVPSPASPESAQSPGQSRSPSPAHSPLPAAPSPNFGKAPPNSPGSPRQLDNPFVSDVANRLALEEAPDAQWLADEWNWAYPCEVRYDATPPLEPSPFHLPLEAHRRDLNKRELYQQQLSSFFKVPDVSGLAGDRVPEGSPNRRRPPTPPAMPDVWARPKKPTVAELLESLMQHRSRDDYTPSDEDDIQVPSPQPHRQSRGGKVKGMDELDKMLALRRRKGQLGGRRTTIADRRAHLEDLSRPRPDPSQRRPQEERQEVQLKLPGPEDWLLSCFKPREKDQEPESPEGSPRRGVAFALPDGSIALPGLSDEAAAPVVPSEAAPAQAPPPRQSDSPQAALQPADTTAADRIFLPADADWPAAAAGEAAVVGEARRRASERQAARPRRPQLKGSTLHPHPTRDADLRFGEREEPPAAELLADALRCVPREAREQQAAQGKQEEPKQGKKKKKKKQGARPVAWQGVGDKVESESGSDSSSSGLHGFAITPEMRRVATVMPAAMRQYLGGDIAGGDNVRSSPFRAFGAGAAMLPPRSGSVAAELAAASPRRFTAVAGARQVQVISPPAPPRQPTSEERQMSASLLQAAVADDTAAEGSAALPTRMPAGGGRRRPPRSPKPPRQRRPRRIFLRQPIATVLPAKPGSSEQVRIGAAAPKCFRTVLRRYSRRVAAGSAPVPASWDCDFDSDTDADGPLASPEREGSVPGSFPRVETAFASLPDGVGSG